MLYEAPARPMRRLKSRPLQLNRNIVAKAYLAAVLWGWLSNNAFAAEVPAESASDSDVLQEVVVSANRREESIQSVGSSVAAETGVQLQELNIARPEDLVRLVPGLGSIPNAGSAATSYAIRGVGQSDYTEHEEQPVAVYQDGVYIALSSATGFPIYDVERAEVERGPQGTLFGRNATGGLIQFFSNKPTQELESGVSVTTGDRNLRRLEGFVSGGTDILTGRIAVYHSERDGFIKNLNGPNLLGDEVNAARAQLEFTPDAATKVNFRLEGWKSAGTSYGGYNQPSYIAPNGYPYPLPANVNYFGKGPGLDIYGFRNTLPPLEADVSNPGAIDKHSGTAALTASHDFGTATFYSTTAFTHSYVYYAEDSDGTLGNVEAYHDGGGENTLSQEFRLQGSGDRFRWTAGVFAISIHGTFNTFLAFPTLCDTQVTAYCSYSITGSAVLDRFNGKGASGVTDYGLTTHSLSEFAQGEYDLTDKFTVILGARNTRDSQHYDYTFQCTPGLPGACNTLLGTLPGLLTVGPFNLSQTYDPWSGKFELEYKVLDDVLLYTSAVRGAKSAGYFSDTAGDSPADKLSFRPEKLNSYEIGVKSAFWDRRITWNTTAFYYDYKDFQTFDFNGVSTSVLNVPAYAKGGESSIAAALPLGLISNLGLAYDDMWVKDILTPLGIQYEKPINAPKWQINWGLSRTFNISQDMKLTPSYSGRFTSDRYWAIVNSATTHTPGFTLHDASLRLDKGNLWVNAWGTNITNHIYTNIAFDQSYQGFYLQHIGEPRTLGLTVGVNFK
jgi:iron complex outermembrane receptor protein